MGYGKSGLLHSLRDDLRHLGVAPGNVDDEELRAGLVQLFLQAHKKILHEPVRLLVVAVVSREGREALSHPVFQEKMGIASRAVEGIFQGRIDILRRRHGDILEDILPGLFIALDDRSRAGVTTPSRPLRPCRIPRVSPSRGSPSPDRIPPARRSVISSLQNSSRCPPALRPWPAPAFSA